MNKIVKKLTLLTLVVLLGSQHGISCAGWNFKEFLPDFRAQMTRYMGDAGQYLKSFTPWQYGLVGASALAGLSLVGYLMYQRGNKSVKVGDSFPVSENKNVPVGPGAVKSQNDEKEKQGQGQEPVDENQQDKVLDFLAEHGKVLPVEQAGIGEGVGAEGVVKEGKQEIESTLSFFKEKKEIVRLDPSENEVISQETFENIINNNYKNGKGTIFAVLEENQQSYVFEAHGLLRYFFGDDHLRSQKSWDEKGRLLRIKVYETDATDLSGDLIRDEYDNKPITIQEEKYVVIVNPYTNNPIGMEGIQFFLKEPAEDYAKFIGTDKELYREESFSATLLQIFYDNPLQ